MNKSLMFAVAAVVAGMSGNAFAAGGINTCPANVNAISEATFGPGAAEMTRCIETRHQLKVIYQINLFTEPNNSSKPYGLGGVQNAINDYTNSYGMTVGKDVKIAVVIHGGAGKLAVKNSVLQSVGSSNPFEATVRSLISQGVDVYLCQNTARGLISSGLLTQGYVTGDIIEGINFVTSGVTAIPDFQSRGYIYVQP